MRHYDLATVIVNYKAEQRTVEFVRDELLPKCTMSQVIVIVDNGSTEQSVVDLSQGLGAFVVDDIANDVVTEADIFVVCSKSNEGYARGNNLGVEFVRLHFDVDFILFSNNDIYISDALVIEKLVMKLRLLPDVAVIGPKVVGLDGRCQSPYLEIPFWKEMVLIPWSRYIPFLHVKLLDMDTAGEGYYYRLMGAFMIVRFDDYVVCGMMDPGTFLFGEEIILAERMLRLSKRSYYFPAVSVVHQHGYTINRNSGSYENRDYFNESLEYYYRRYKNVGRLSIIIARASRYLLRATRSAARSLFRR